MNFQFLTSALLALSAGLIPLLASADIAKSAPPTFRYTCTTEWRARVDITNKDQDDKVLYLMVGEKYCACALTQPFDSSRVESQVKHLCIPRSLLRDTMDGVRDEVGFREVTLGDINEYCQDRLNMVYPKMKGINKKTDLGFCTCAKEKLLNLTRRADKIPDESYIQEINGIAKECSGKITLD